MPAAVDVVQRQRSDVPFDSGAPLSPLGFGLQLWLSYGSGRCAFHSATMRGYSSSSNR